MLAKRFALVAAAIIPALAANSTNFEIDGTQLRAACLSDQAAKQVFCRAYIFEIARSIDAGMFPAAKRCIPDNPDPIRLVAIIKKYLDEHPENLRDPADALVTIALFKAFNCA